MNERIRELIEECTDRHFGQGVGGFETFDKEKFAQLIVQECVGLLGPAHSIMADPIKKHFGVE
jgi:hypothetical protein